LSGFLKLLNISFLPGATKSRLVLEPPIFFFFFFFFSFPGQSEQSKIFNREKRF
jgi:hypothetical protein